MRIGITQLTSGTSGVDLIDRAAALGVEGVEPMIYPAECEYLAWDRDQGQRFARGGKEKGVLVPAAAMGVFTGEDALVSESGKDRAVDLIYRSLVFTAAVEAEVMMLCNFFASQPDTEEKKRRTIEVLRAAAPEAGRRRVTIGLESPLPAGELLEMVDAVGSEWVGIYYDVGNAVALGFDPAAEIGQLRGRIVGMHIKDTEQTLGDSHLGRGRVDLDGCLKAMREADYAGWLVLETLPDDEEAVRGDIEVLRSKLQQ